MEPLRRPPIAFAHRGGRAHAPENSLEAFQLGLRLGASGLESDVWLTADGVAVLDHDGRVGSRLRHRDIGQVSRSALPGHIPTLADLYRECGTDFELSLDIKAQDAAEASMAVARAAGNGAEERLWMCHPDLDVLARWRSLWPTVHLVDSTRLKLMRHGPERRAAQLAEVGIDAVNLHHSDWSAGLTTLFHRFGRLAFAWDAQYERVLRDLLRMGVDGLYGDHVDRLVEAVNQQS
ncbi:MAG: glycerophosphodiester phosphodiesterase [Actinomycetota bacterium]|nr:glycerophosphodiester phosphodiesterase [Actinomycetota bacterium]